MKKEETKISCLYDLSHTQARSLLEQYTYPWEVLPHIGAFIKELGKTLSEEEYEKRGENAIVHSSAPTPLWERGLWWEIPPSLRMSFFLIKYRSPITITWATLF